MESQPISATATELESGAPPTQRLVIRINLGPEAALVPPATRRPNRRVLLLIVGAVAVEAALSWTGIRMFKSEPASAPSAVTPVRSESLSTRAIDVAPNSTARRIESKPRQQPDAPPVAINEVLPDVPRSARNTIRGTIRVSVRVVVGRKGTVLTAAADDPGPSRYFERLAIDAAKQWTFTPAAANERPMRVQFNFKRDATTAHAEPYD